jgi:hypothetical protein
MSNIDPSKPEEGLATTESVRDNFQAAADEIDQLTAADAQNVKLSGAQSITGAKTFTSNPLYTGNQNQSDTALTLKSYVDQAIADAIASIPTAEKPIGALVFGYDPNGLEVGTWTQIPEGTFIMATVANADPAGGSNDAVVVAHNHTSPAHNHSAAAVGNHTHGLPRATSTSNSPNLGFNSGNAIVDYANTSAAAGGHTPTINAAAATINSAGESGAGKNRPLYLGVEAWRRTA